MTEVGSGDTRRGGMVVCGEALIDLVRQDGAPEAAEPPSYRAFPGGGPANTAVALARLGIPSYLAARLAEDMFGVQLRSHLERNHVDLRYAVTAAEPTTIAVVNLTPAGDADYSFYVEGTADFRWADGELPTDLPDSIEVVHAGSLALALPPGSIMVEAFLRRMQGRKVIAIDPNVRPVLITDLNAYRSALERWVRLADVVKVSEDDLRVVYPDAEPFDVVREWQADARLVVLTRGAEDVVAMSGGRQVRVTPPRVTVVDTVAAGDTFSAGLLDGLRRSTKLMPGLPGLPEAAITYAVSRGCAAAALACQRLGADPPYASQLPQ